MQPRMAGPSTHCWLTPGNGLGGSFLDQDFNDIRHVIDTNVTGTIYLIQKVARDMRARGEGRILITGSIAGYTPGTFNATYNASKRRLLIRFRSRCGQN